MRTWLVVGLSVVAGDAQAAPFDLAHQGRALHASGVPVDGAHDLVLRLYDSGGAVLLTRTYPATPFDSGTYSVVLTGVDTAWLDGVVTLGVSIDGTELAPRSVLTTSPRAGRALVAERVPVNPTSLSGPCTDVGAIRFDDVANKLKFCDGTAWRLVLSTGGTTTVVGGARRWDDDTFAATCDAYRNPTDGLHTWNSAGSGLYDIDPEADGTALRVWCDMESDAFGWTLMVGPGSPSMCFYWWYAWSDFGNVCSGSGAQWTLSAVAIR